MVSVNGTSRMIALGVVLDDVAQWDGQHVVLRSDAKQMNSLLMARMSMATAVMLDMDSRGEPYDCALMVSEISKRIAPERQMEADASVMNEHSVLTIWREFMAKKTGRTWEIYETALRRLREYVGENADERLSAMSFDEVTRQWVDGWAEYMSEHGMKTNTRSIYMRCLRAVCMYAWKYDHTTSYLFKSYRIQREDGEVEPLTAAEFKAVMTSYCEPEVEMYRDIALLGFCLIGMNVVDMASMMWEDIRNGYLHYTRAKTHRRYRIRIEPEAQAIIDKYAGDEHVLSWADRYNDYKSFLQHMNEEGLQRIGPCEWKEIKDSYHTRRCKVWHPIMPRLTYYQLRHTWACFAADLDIPKDTIALCLGHGRKTVTDVYVRYDQRKIDEANRKVIDYAFTLIKEK